MVFVVWCVYNKEFTWGTFLSQFSRVTSQFFKLNACYPVGLLQQGLKEGKIIQDFVRKEDRWLHVRDTCWLKLRCIIACWINYGTAFQLRIGKDNFAELYQFCFGESIYFPVDPQRSSEGNVVVRISR